jgi:hypothetical protein
MLLCQFVIYIVFTFKWPYLPHKNSLELEFLYIFHHIARRVAGAYFEVKIYYLFSLPSYCASRQ